LETNRLLKKLFSDILQRDMEMKLLGRTCLITGASRGLGRELAAKFWQEGASLALVFRSVSDPLAFLESLGKPATPQQRCALVRANLESAAEVDAIKAQVEQQFDSVTVLVNNAASLGPIGPSCDTGLDDWAKVFNVNLFSPVRLCSLFLPEMRARGYGKILNLSGGGATSPRPHFSAYASSKSALVRYSETLAQELLGTGIDVNCIAPGIMATGMTAQVIQAGRNIAGAEEVAKAEGSHRDSESSFSRAVDLSVFLASADSDGLTGRLISAAWDSWQDFKQHLADIQNSDVFTLRRIVPRDRGMTWGNQ
jgi:NAD(P)-dependent dehydrogenase (short-subunit alcohol dehydrogenase family)